MPKSTLWTIRAMSSRGWDWLLEHVEIELFTF